MNVSSDLCPSTVHVLLELAHPGDKHIPHLRMLARDIDMPVEQLRRIVLRLKDAGIVTYGPISDPESGAPWGSSYWLTETGVALQHSLRQTAVAA